MTLIFKNTCKGYFGNLYFNSRDFTDFITAKGKKTHCWKHVITKCYVQSILEKGIFIDFITGYLLISGFFPISFCSDLYSNVP